MIRNAVTEMGKLSAELQFTGHGATVKLDTRFHTPPRHIVVPVPYFVALKALKSDAADYREQDGYLIFSPDVSFIDLQWNIKQDEFEDTFQNILISYRKENSLKWRGLEDAVIIPGGQGFLLGEERDHPGEPLSFDLVKQAFIREYMRRFDQYIRAGKKPMQVLAPELKPGILEP
jgi:hypothetical protein